jgi:tetratricopeptide (TPR) repeat protein
MVRPQPNADVLRSARELILKGSPQRAIDLIESAWGGRGAPPPAAILVLAEAFDAAGRSEEADRILNAAANVLPSNGFIRFQLGVRALRNGAYEAALGISEALIAEGKDQPSRFLLNANALKALGRTAQALDALGRARARFGDNADLAVLQAQIL